MRIKLLFAFMLLAIAAFGQQNPIQIDANGLTQTLASGGLVTRGQIVKINGSGQVVPVATTDTSGAIGIAATSQQNQGQSVTVSIAGTPLVQIDSGGCVAGNIVSISTLAGGSGHCAASASGQQVGVALSISSPGSNFWNVALSLGGSGGGGGISASGVIDTTTSKYATPIANHIPDATFTSGQATIDCTFANDCNFTAANAGNVCFGTNFTTDVSIINPTSVVLAEGTLTVTDAQHATCSGGNSTATTVHNGWFAWGKLGHTQLNSAWTDCLTQAASGGCNLQLPAGPVLVEAPVGITNPTNPSYIEAQGYGKLHVRGWGASISQLIPTPNFSGAACIGGPITGVDNNGCFFSGTSINMSDFGIFGGGQANLGAGFNGKAGMIISGQQPSGAGANSYLNSLDLFSWGATTTGFTGLKIEGQSDTTAHDVHLDGLGSTGCSVTGGFTSTLTTFEGTYCAVNGNQSLVVAGGFFTSHGGVYGWIGGGASPTDAVLCSGASVFCTFFGDTAPYQTANSHGQFTSASGGILRLNGVFMAIPTGSFYCTNSSAGTIYIESTVCEMPPSGGQGHIINATGVLISQGGNIVTACSGGEPINLASATGKFIEYAPDSLGTGCPWGFTAGATVSGPGTNYGSCTGTITSATTVGLYGLGQTAATTCTSTTTGSGVVMDRAGTVLALFGTAGTAGNQAADAVTIVKNHQGTITVTTMTCSLNAVTSCADSTVAHQVAYAQGDILSIEAIGGTATTLANISATMVRQ